MAEQALTEQMVAMIPEFVEVIGRTGTVFAELWDGNGNQYTLTLKRTDLLEQAYNAPDEINPPFMKETE